MKLALHVCLIWSNACQTETSERIASGPLPAYDEASMDKSIARLRDTVYVVDVKPGRTDGFDGLLIISLGWYTIIQYAMHVRLYRNMKSNHGDANSSSVKQLLEVKPKTDFSTISNLIVYSCSFALVKKSGSLRNFSVNFINHLWRYKASIYWLW